MNYERIIQEGGRSALRVTVIEATGSMIHACNCISEAAEEEDSDRIKKNMEIIESRLETIGEVMDILTGYHHLSQLIGTDKPKEKK